MGANKYSVETQIDFFHKTIDGKSLEYDRVDDLSGQMMPGDIHKVTEQDIQAVRDFIKNEEDKYPDTGLKSLFREWEKLQGQYEEKLSKEKAAVTAEAAKKVEEAKRKQEEETSARKLNDANKKEKEEKEALARKLEEEKEQKDKKPSETTQNKKTSVPQSGENAEKKPDKPQKIDIAQSPEKNNTHEVRTSMIFKDGAYYLVGPKGRPTRVDFQNFAQMVVSKDAPEKLQKSVFIVQDLALVLDAYLLANPKEKIKYGTAVDSAKKLFSDDDVRLGNKAIDTKSVTEITGKLFSNSRVSFGDTDLRSINEALRKEDPKVRHLAVLQFIRERLGQYDLVAKTLIQENQGAFGFPADADLVKEGVDLSSTGLGKAWLEKVREAIGKARAEATKNWNKNNKEYIEAYKQQNPGIVIDPERARLENEKLTVLYFAKQEIAYQTLYNKPQQSPELKMLQDVLGAGTLKMSDRVADITGEAFKMLAFEAIALAAGVVTAWAGTVAINAAILGRNAFRWAKAIEAYNAASKTRQLSTTAGRILGSGAGFELWHANMISIMEGEGLTLWTREWYAQSIAMMGVLKGVGSLIEKGVFGKGFQFKEGAGFWKNTLPFTGQVIIEGTAIFGTAGVVGQIMVDGRDNWTPEQLAQAMIMAAFFKGASRVMISRAQNGEVRTEPVVENVSPSVIVAERVATIREYTVNQRLKTQKEKVDFINSAQPGDIVLLKNIGKLEKEPDGRWSLTASDGGMKWFDTNEALIADAISGKGRGSKNFIIERLGGEPTVTATPNGAGAAPAEPAPEKLSEGKFLKAADGIWKQAKKNTDSIVIGEYSVKWNTQTKKLDVTLPENGGVRSFDTQGKFVLFLKEGNKSKGIIDTIKAQKGNPAREVRIGETEYAINKEGKFIKKETNGDRELTSEEISWLIDRNPGAVFDAVTNTKAFWKGFDETIAYFKNTPGKFLGDVLTKEAKTDGWMAAPGTIANVTRYPIVTARIIVETIRGESTSKTTDILKAVLLGNKNAFQKGWSKDHKAQALATTMLVAYVGTQAVNNLHSNHPDAKGISNGAIAFLEYVKNMQLSPMIDTLAFTQIEAVKKASEAVEKW